MNPIPIQLAVEDDLSEAVVRKVIDRSRQSYAIGCAYGKTGFGYLKKKIKAFNNAAKGTPFLVLTDLDRTECPPVLIDEWFRRTTKHPNLLFRVAVREVEAWLLAHRRAFAHFVGIRESLVPMNVDALDDAKQCLIDLVVKSRRKTLREDIQPPKGSTRKQGPNYNGRLEEYIQAYWEPHEAMCNSASLSGLVKTLDDFAPQWRRSGIIG